MFLEQVIHKKKVYSLIVRSKNQFKKEGVNFVTKKKHLFQLGFLKHKKNHKIKSHIHLKKIRNISYLSECLLVKKGIIKVIFYDEKKKNIKQDKILKKGDLILLFNGGHGFEVLKDVEIIEIKQGPFYKDKDKVVF